jgi:hypothetical protein
MTVKLSYFAGAGWQFFDNSGNVLTGGKIYSYSAGTTTPLVTYTSSTGLVPNSNPIILDASGRLSGSGEIWLDRQQNYKFVLTTSTDVLIGTYDNIPALNDVTAADVIYTPAGVGAVPTTVEAKLNQYVSLPDYTTLRNALATGQRVQIPPTTTSISVSTTDSPFILPYLYLIDAESNLTLSLASGVHTIASGNIANIGQNGSISVVGATPPTTTLTSVSNVSGAAGSYSVDLQVADGSIVSIGDYLKLDNVVPLLTLSGDNSVFRDRLADNELLQCSALLGNATCTTGGTTVVFGSVESGYVLSNIIQTNDLITIKGQTRKVTLVTDATRTLTVDSAWTLGTTGTRGYWVSKSNSGIVSTASGVNTGTVSTAGVPSTTIAGAGTLFLTEVAVNDLIQVGTATARVTAIASDISLTVATNITITLGSSYLVIKPSTTVTGTSTSFTTQANIGDMLLVNGCMATITNITNNTSITVAPATTIPDGLNFSVITTGLAHEGTYEVTNVAGNVVTVTNPWRGLYPPPTNKISGGEVKVIKTILRNTGSGDGLSFRQNSAIKFVDNLVLRGNNSSTGSHGIALNGRLAEGPTQLGDVGIMNGGSGLAVMAWGRGAFIGHGCSLQTRRSHYINNRSFGVWALEGSSCILRECVISSTIGRGMQLNTNSTTKFTEGYSVGNTSDGCAMEIDAAIYAEIPGFYQNGGMGMRINGGTAHINEGVAALNNLSGIYALNGATIDMARLLLVGNQRENVELLNNAVVVGEEIWSTGATGDTGNGYGVDFLDSAGVLDQCALTNNAGGPGYFSGPYCNISATRAYITGVQNNGLQAFNLARVMLSNGQVEKFNVGLGGYFMVNGVSPTPVPNLAIVDKQIQVLQIVNFGTVGANSSSTQTVTVNGATTSDTVFVSISNQSSLIPDGLILDAGVTATNTVSVRLQNRTGGGIAATNQSLRITVIGYT